MGTQNLLLWLLFFLASLVIKLLSSPSFGGHLSVYATYTGITLRTTNIFWLCYLPLRRSMGTPIFYPTYLLDLISTMSDSLKRTLLIMFLYGSQLLFREIIYLITIVKRETSLLHSQEHHGKHLPKLGHCFNSLNFHR